MADLWWFMLVLGAAIFLLFMALLARGLLREAPEESAEDPRHERLVGRWIGMGGVAMPAVVIAAVFIATIVAMREVPDSAPPDALEIEVTGHQFWYEVHYPDSGLVTANELHLPTGRPIALRLRSTDVIHSFWVPELGGKLDMLPERMNTLVLQADEPGEFRSRCAEFCGLSHANMHLVVVAESAEEYEDWISSQLAFSEPDDQQAREGLDVFVGKDCASCHALRGTDASGTEGPDLTAFPSRTTIGAGLLPNTPENLADWIRDPEALKPGVLMPGTELSDRELDALLAYLGVDR